MPIPDKVIATIKVDASDAQKWVKKFLAEFQVIEAEQLARLFHETYERLAPEYGYGTHKEIIPWANVPEQNKQLDIAVCAEILQKYICGYVRNNGYLPGGEAANGGETETTH